MDKSIVELLKRFIWLCPKCGKSRYVRLHMYYQVKNGEKRTKYYYKKCEIFFTETNTPRRIPPTIYRHRYPYETMKKAAFLQMNGEKIVKIAQQLKVNRKAIYKWFWKITKNKKLIEDLK